MQLAEVACWCLTITNPGKGSVINAGWNTAGSALHRKGSGALLQGRVASRVGYTHVYFLTLSRPQGTHRRIGGCIGDAIHLNKVTRSDRNITGFLFRQEHICYLIQDISEMNLHSQPRICCSKEHCLAARALHQCS